jgi:hypothetical protein
MDVVQVVQLLTNAPLTLVLLYLLVSEQKSHTETRKQRDGDQRAFMERFAGLAERVAAAVERLDLPGPT